jgi:hypothetical protein
MRQPYRAVLSALALAVQAACSSGAGGQPGPGSGTITVTGRVTGPNGRPVLFVPVVVSGKPAVNSGADGRFNVDGVTAPYDLTIVRPSDTYAYATTFLGLTRSDPTLRLDTDDGAIQESSYSGTLSGPGFTVSQPSGWETLIVFASPDLSSSGGTYSGPFSGLFDTTASWRGPFQTLGSIIALQYATDANRTPQSYKGFGRLDNVALRAGSKTPALNVPMSPISGLSLSWQATAPDGFSVAQQSVQMKLGATNTYVAGSSLPTANGTIALPGVAGATFRFCITALSGTGDSRRSSTACKTDLAPNAGSVSLVLPQVPDLMEPAAGATGITTSTRFSWTAVAGSVYRFSFGGAGGLSRIVYTATPSITIPDLSSVGYPLPKSAPGSWAVQTIGPAGGIDAIAEPDLESYRGDQNTYSGSRKATTAP